MHFHHKLLKVEIEERFFGKSQPKKSNFKYNSSAQTWETFS